MKALHLPTLTVALVGVVVIVALYHLTLGRKA